MRLRGSERHRFGVVGSSSIATSAVVAVIAHVVISATVAAGTPTASIAAYRLSATALFMGGTGQPLIIPPDTPEFISSYVNKMNTDFVATTGLCTGGDPGCTLIAVYTPEQLRPLIGDMTFDESAAIGLGLLDNCIQGAACTATYAPFTTTVATNLTDTSYVIFGRSQSAVISSFAKSDLIAHPPTGKTVSFVLLSNESRPNGGVLERFVGAYIPIFGISFTGATQTNSPQPTPLTTVDYASQYDGWVDFPTNPLNLLASLNAVLGTFFLHHDTDTYSGTPQLQGYYQDSTYYLLPNELLPLVIPLSQIPVIGLPLARALDPPLRVLVETGYDRTINPGQPTPAKYLYFPNPVKTLVDFLTAIPTGWDDAIATITGNPANRPFHTSPQPAYGVGGPPIYAGAIDPYGPVDPPASVAVSDIEPAAAHSAAGRAKRHLVSTAEARKPGTADGSGERRRRSAANRDPSPTARGNAVSRPARSPRTSPAPTAEPGSPGRSPGRAAAARSSW